jgi:hypothetical protein
MHLHALNFLHFIVSAPVKHILNHLNTCHHLKNEKLKVREVNVPARRSLIPIA